MVNLVAASDGEAVPAAAFPCRFEVHEHVGIPLSDGTVLSARLWLPVIARDTPVPAVVEYAPFRHRDVTAPRDALLHPWFAGHGHAAVRLELRGSGDSTGLPMDEYVAREQADALEALAWIAAQPWCNGRTALIGMSWGAFSALQVAALQPPSLATIIAVHGTDDRFADDVHYMGGCPLYNNLSWGALLFAYLARPPDPTLTGEAWRERWLERLEQAPFVLETWARHQRRDAYWRHASVCEDYAAIDVPVYVACGWTDGYTDAAFRLAEGLVTPRRVVVGPWAHTYPHVANPAPRVDFLGDVVRWMDRWGKDATNGIDEEAPIQVFMQDGASPDPALFERDGCWTAVDRWPPAAAADTRWSLGSGALSRGQVEPGQPSMRSSPATGATGGEWLAHGVGPELPLDLRNDGGSALTWESAPLEDDCWLLGQPLFKARVRSDTPTGQVAVHLGEVRPDGRVTRITYGLLDLTARAGFDRHDPLPVNEWVEVTVKLKTIGQRLRRGQRLRVDLTTECWPLAWPAHDRMTLTVDEATSCLVLPETPRPVPLEPSFGPARVPAGSAVTMLAPVSRERVLERDLATGRVRRRYVRDDGRYRVDEHGGEVASWFEQDYWVVDDPEAEAAGLAGGVIRASLRHERDDWKTRVDLDASQTMTDTGWRIDATLTLFEDETAIASRTERVHVDRHGLGNGATTNGTSGEDMT